MTVKLKNQFSGLPFWAGIALISLLQCQQKEGKNLKKGWMIFTLEKKIDLVWVQIVLCPQEVAFLKTPKSGLQVRVTQKD